MVTTKFSFRLLMSMMICLMGMTVQAYGETTKRVNFFQRTSSGVIDPGTGEGTRDTGNQVTCILYKESGRCEFDPDIEAVKKYEIYNGTARVGIYYDQFSFVQDAFNLRGVLILTLTTDSSQLSGKILNY